ncbi:hypothetical protein FRC11_007274, partial [Ceratobasidium sp. 423]
MSRIDKFKAKLATKLRLGSSDVTQLDAKKGRIDSGSRTTVKAALVLPGVVRKEKPGNFLSAFFGLSSKEQQADDRSRFTFEPSEHLDGAKHEPTGNGSDASVWSGVDKKSQVAPEESKISKRDGNVVDQYAASPDSKRASTIPASGEHCDRQEAKNETYSRDIDSNSLQQGERVGVPKPKSPPISPITTPGQAQDIPTTPVHHETTGLPRPQRGDTDATRSGANTERGHSEAPTPKRPTVELPKRDDDPLTYLVILFGYTTLEDSEGSEDGPKSALCKGNNDKHYFYAFSSLCYFDNFKNVFLQDGTLIRNGPFDSNLGSALDPYCFIDGRPH